MSVDETTLKTCILAYRVTYKSSRPAEGARLGRSYENSILILSHSIDDGIACEFGAARLRGEKKGRGHEVQHASYMYYIIKVEEIPNVG